MTPHRHAVTASQIALMLSLPTLAVVPARAADDLAFHSEAAYAQPAPSSPSPQPKPAESVAAPADAAAGDGPLGRLNYGKAGTWWGAVTGGYARSVNSGVSNEGSAHFTASTFLVDTFELALEFGGWYFNQPGQDAFAPNFNLIFRWHFFHDGDLTVFGDAGAGLLWATDPVPFDGTRFNFTPRAGVGFTHALGDDGTRFILGVRWHHISNARVVGAGRNPGRDGVHLYAGVVFPF